jgi:hypothetical protein
MAMKRYLAVFAALALTAAAGSAFADGPGYSGDHDSIPSRMSAESVSTVDAYRGSISGPVETGAVPEKSTGDRLSPTSTHYNPFYPETRAIDLGGGGQ